jgi:hypothetical protein
MMIAIHNRPGSFSDRWIAYCDKHNVSYKLVNCYDSTIIQQLTGCDGLMWHWTHEDYRAQNFARQLIFSLEKKGIRIFPDFNTCFHFDDKVGQKYLFETIQAPLVNSYVFYSKEDARVWIDQTTFPKVFKLRGGAGASNVQLVKNRYRAIKLLNRAFGTGFPMISQYSDFKQRVWELRRDQSPKAILHLIRGLYRLFVAKEKIGLLPRQKGYAYFQDFIPENSFDDRIVIIGNRAIALRRYNRVNDFRASGSGIIKYDPNLFNLKSIQIAFDVADKIKSQSLALDFVYDKSGSPLLVEMSYGFSMGAVYDNCPGYWDKSLYFHADNVDPQRFIIEDFINSMS